MSFVLPKIWPDDSKPVQALANWHRSYCGHCKVGNSESDKPSDIRLSGLAIQSEHCYFEHPEDGTVSLTALEGGITMVNGRRLEPGKVLSRYIATAVIACIHLLSSRNSYGRAIESSWAISTFSVLSKSTDFPLFCPR
jgi:hypothetical protein